MSRSDGRQVDQLRPVKITRDFIKHAEGSVLIEFGDTKVVCTASVEEKVPPFLRGKGSGWVTAEYGMLPRATGTRNIRDISKGKLSGRSSEIGRLIGRSMRSIVDMKALGERTIWIDCDVIQADGGTRTAAITGAFIALSDAVAFLQKRYRSMEYPLKDFVAAISVGIVDSKVLLDLCYCEDACAQVDMNVVMTGNGRLIEVQGTAETEPFSREEMTQLLDVAGAGIQQLVRLQRQALTTTLTQE